MFGRPKERARPAPGRATLASPLATVTVVAAIGLFASMPLPAQYLSPQDCREGADFIRNAALSRDNGLAAAAFADRLESDIRAVMGMRPEVRWFVYGDAEADLLRRQSAEVFRDPQAPEVHLQRFLRACDHLRASLQPGLVLAP